MVEKAMPVYRDAVEVQGASTAGLDPAAKTDVIRAKLAVKGVVKDYGALLFPEDDDG